VRVAAGAPLGLEEVGVVALLAKQVGRGHAGDAASDDGDAQWDSGG
jgi:hypothetical protein